MSKRSVRIITKRWIPLVVLLLGLFFVPAGILAQGASGRRRGLRLPLVLLLAGLLSSGALLYRVVERPLRDGGTSRSRNRVPSPDEGRVGTSEEEFQSLT